MRYKSDYSAVLERNGEGRLRGSESQSGCMCLKGEREKDRETEGVRKRHRERKRVIVESRREWIIEREDSERASEREGEREDM